MSQLAGIRCVLFDAVGTLIYADPPVAHVYHAAAQRYGSQHSLDEIKRRFPAALAEHHRGHQPTSEARERNRWRSIVRHVIADVGDRQEVLFEELWNHFAQPDHWRLYDDVAAAWEQLVRCGYRLGIASNFDQRLQRVIAGHAPMAGCEDLFVSSELGFLKPDPRFFRAVQQKLALGPAQIALVGDDEIADIAGATAAGWRAIRLNRTVVAAGSPSIHSLLEIG